MGRSSSGIGSVLVASKDPDAIALWEQEGWQALYMPDGDTLGEGGWGVVRPVRHVASGERRALKHPLHDNEEARARFKREIEVQSKIHHRHVMPVLDHDDRFSWFTMPLALRTLETGAPEMLNDELATVVAHAARGLKAAHDNEYVHRDVKPSNILEVGRGNDDSPIWVVGDFGVVRRPANEATNLKTKHALGTEGFMAPEVVLGKHGNITLLADVYSLGRTIAWATTGVRPEGLAPLEARWPWATLVARMTAFDPGATVAPRATHHAPWLPRRTLRRPRRFGRGGPAAEGHGRGDRCGRGHRQDLARSASEALGQAFGTLDTLDERGIHPRRCL